MNNAQKLKAFWNRAPVVFPLAAIFHLVVFILGTVNLIGFPLTHPEWLQPLSLGLFAVLSLALCWLKKWAAFGYIILSCVCLAFIYTQQDGALRTFGEAAFPFNLIISFFVLLFFRRFK